MDFRTSLTSARSYALAAIGELNAYDRSAGPDSPQNRRVLDNAGRYISPGATGAGSDALDASRWERWVTTRQIRDTGHALELLDRAWWDLRGGRGGGMPNVDAATRALYEAVSMLDSAARGGWGRWAAPAPLVA